MFVGIANRPAVAIVVMAITALLLCGCTPEPAPGPGALRQQSSPVPTPATAAYVPTTAPAQVFGGDCGALFSDGEMTAALRSSATLSTQQGWVRPSDRAVQNIGGISCIWQADEAFVEFDVIPAGVVTTPPSRVTCGVGDGQLGSVFRCDIDTTVAGVVLPGVVGLDSSLPKAQAAADELVAVFAARAPAGLAATPVADPEAWPTPLDCNAANTAALAAELGDAASLVALSTGGDAYRTAVQVALEGDAYIFTCGYGNPALTVDQKTAGVLGSISFAALGGGAWVYSDLVDHAVAVTVSGFDAALLGRENGSFVLNLFSGPNWMQAIGSDDDFTAQYEALRIIAGSL